MDSADARWEGYWRVADEKYYARCVRHDGTHQWYRLADMPREVDSRVVELAAWRRRNRPLETSGRARQMLLVGRRGQRPILVGTSQRSTTPRSTR